MSTQDNSGPAFPVPLTAGHYWSGEVDPNGMSLRDYFAAKAMQALMHQPREWVNEGGGELCNPASIAPAAYGFADAMLKARQS